jgi:polysaccharide pyruvyl transferase WcaK-like protein
MDMTGQVLHKNPASGQARTEPAAGEAPLRIAALGWCGAGNLGNDGMLEALTNFIRREYPDAQITAVCAGPEDVKARLGVEAVQMRWEPQSWPLRALNKLALKTPSALFNWLYTQHHIRHFDVLIVFGALMDDYRTNFLGRPSVMRRWCAAAKRNRVKLAFVSAGADPITDPLSRWMVKPVGDMALYRSYRDEGSRAYMHSIGIDETHTPVYPDLVWGLPEPAHAPPRRDGRLTIGVGVMAYHGWKSIEAGHAVHEAYVDKMTAFVDWLADEGHRVRLLIGERSDTRVVNAIQARARCVSTDAWTPPSPAQSLHDVMAQIVDCDAVVASRFHNILCALKLGRPTISLSYMSKCHELLEQAGVPGFHLMIEAFALDELKQSFRRLMAERGALEATIAGRVKALKARLKEQEARLMREVFAR